jgi:hypothetical protein
MSFGAVFRLDVAGHILAPAANASSLLVTPSQQTVNSASFVLQRKCCVIECPNAFEEIRSSAEGTEGTLPCKQGHVKCEYFGPSPQSSEF